MRAMILCAGLGTRLRPLTNLVPKPAIPLLDVSLFHFNLAVLRRGGVRALGINTHHLPEVMREVAQAECARVNVPLTVSYEPEIQGTGGGIRGLQRFLEEDHFVVMNGDVLFGLELAPLVERHRQSGAAATMVLMAMPPGEKFAAVELDAKSRVRKIAGLGPGGEDLTPWHFTGVHLMSPAVFDFMSGEGPEDINREVYLRMIEAGLTVRGEIVSGYWSDLGTPERYLKTHADLLAGRVDLAPFGDASPFTEVIDRGGRCFVHPRAEVDSRALIGPCFVGDGAIVQVGARIGPFTSVGQGAKVCEGASLENAAVLPAAQVSAGETVRDRIVIPDSKA